MILKMTEWAGMWLLAIVFARLVMFVSNNDPDSVWEKTEEAEDKVMHFMSGFLRLDKEGTPA